MQITLTANRMIPLIAVLLFTAVVDTSAGTLSLTDKEILNLKLMVAPSEVARQELLGDADYVFDFGGAVGVTSGEGGSTVGATATNFPALIGHGSAMTIGFIDACGINLPHTHPRSTELNFAVKGTFQAGFFLQNGARYVTRNISAGQVIVFPKGAIHFEQNLGCTPAMFVAGFNHVDPGVSTTSSAYFSLPNDIAGVGIGANAKSVAAIVKRLAANPALGIAECRKKCNIK
eukprot:TRINITY_DN29_c0_g1_i1.p1 TRINITY_DN29_c0_g1~~TRINITY_DN29_c0_g1_i1.p1  ORF type:complete len:232 (+),score=23.79 TRINITY_DN29_c0_g1_i1:345-1040(+)